MLYLRKSKKIIVIYEFLLFNFENYLVFLFFCGLEVIFFMVLVIDLVFVNDIFLLIVR